MVCESGMRGFLISVAAVCVVPGAKACKSAGITQVYLDFSRYLPIFADFASKKALPLALVSVTQVVSDTTF